MLNVLDCKEESQSCSSVMSIQIWMSANKKPGILTFGSIFTWWTWREKETFVELAILCITYVSRSAHTNNQFYETRKSIISYSSSNTQFYESRIFCLITFEYFLQIKYLNWYQNTPKNATITCYIKKEKKNLCNTINWEIWNWGFDELNETNITNLSKVSQSVFKIFDMISYLYWHFLMYFGLNLKFLSCQYLLTK